MGMFPTTRWSVFLAGRDDPDAARSALAHLCQVYRRPVLAYVRRWARSSSEAEDLTQAFFTALIERRIDTQADPLRGRFRALLLTALKRFLINAAAARSSTIRAQIADGLEVIEELHVSEDAGPERVFMRQWALTVVDRALAALREEAAGNGKLRLFDALRGFLIEAPDPEDYARLAAEFGMRSNTLAVATHRLRHRLRAQVRAELAETVDSEEAVEAEMQILREALGGALQDMAARRSGRGRASL